MDQIRRAIEVGIDLEENQSATDLSGCSPLEQLLLILSFSDISFVVGSFFTEKKKKKKKKEKEKSFSIEIARSSLMDSRKPLLIAGLLRPYVLDIHTLNTYTTTAIIITNR